MGKSPAKWIKAILLGKKSSKSHASKGREKYTNEKQVLVSAKDSEVGPGVDAPVLSHLAIDKNERKIGVKNDEAASLSHEKLTRNQDAGIQGSTCRSSLNDHDRIIGEKAAKKVQAAFRGYLARRAFRALKGIIRLQALIRGHLVRRQAVATLNCTLRIVKFQAVIRGRIVRQSDEVRRKCIVVKRMDEQPLADPAEVTLSARMAKFSANIFIFKLVASFPTAKPLQIHYDPEDQNSVSSWLERWSKTQFWKPLPRPKKITEPKFHKKQINGQISEAQSVRSKRTRKLPGSNNDSSSVQMSSEIEKPKRNLRKVSSHAVDQVQDNPQSELEKVKRSLRKVHNTVADNSVQIEAETEKQKETLEKSSIASARELFDRSVSNSTERMKKEIPVISNKSNEEIESEASVMKEIPDVTCTDQVVADLNPSMEIKDQITVQDAADSKVLTENHINNENIAVVNGESNDKEDLMNSENQKSSKKVSTPAKPVENGLQNSPSIPSYMAATESAKAKLRAQGSPRFGNETEKNNIVRRHSLPSSTNGKISSQSPRTQRLVQASGKSGHKSDKSLLASKDGNAKLTQAEWRR